MSHEYALNQYVNTEYNNLHHNLQININILTLKNLSVSKLTSPSITSTNGERGSIFSPIHDKIKYSDLS